MLRVEVKDAPTSELQTVGDVVQLGATPGDDTLRVSGVVVSQLQDMTLTLGVGKFQYRFRVKRQGGVFTLKVLEGTTVLVEQELDTKYGTIGRVFNFEVKP